MVTLFNLNNGFQHYINKIYRGDAQSPKKNAWVGSKKGEHSLEDQDDP